MDSFRFRAFAFISKQDFEKAVEDYSSVLEAKKGDSAALERRGFAYRSLKQYDKAIEDFTALIEESPKDGEAYKRRGYAYSLNGDNEKAVEDFKKAVKLKPGDQDAAARLKALESKTAKPASPPAPAGGTPVMATPPPVGSPAPASSLAPPPERNLLKLLDHFTVCLRRRQPQSRGRKLL